MTLGKWVSCHRAIGIVQVWNCKCWKHFIDVDVDRVRVVSTVTVCFHDFPFPIG